MLVKGAPDAQPDGQSDGHLGNSLSDGRQKDQMADGRQKTKYIQHLKAETFRQWKNQNKILLGILQWEFPHWQKKHLFIQSGLHETLVLLSSSNCDKFNSEIKQFAVPRYTASSSPSIFQSVSHAPPLLPMETQFTQIRLGVT